LSGRTGVPPDGSIAVRGSGGSRELFRLEKT